MFFASVFFLLPPTYHAAPHAYASITAGQHNAHVKIFISWSGEHSQKVAEALKRLLKVVIQSSDPWVSASEIRAGERWSETIAQQLNDINFGIICVTPSNQASPWINFEAGAISKNVGFGKVVPYLHGLTIPNMSNGPLKQFQAKESTKQGTLDILIAINSLLDSPLQAEVLEDALDASWDRYISALDSINISPQDEALAVRSSEDKMDEIISLLNSTSTIDEIKNLNRSVKFLTVLATDGKTDPEKIIPNINRMLSLQARAFLRVADVVIDDKSKTVTFGFSEKNRFHFKQAVSKKIEISKAVDAVTHGTYQAIIVGPDPIREIIIDTDDLPPEDDELPW